MAENDCDTLYELLFGTSPAVEDFRPSVVANSVFSSFLSYTTVILNIVTIHAIRKTALLPKPLRTLLLNPKPGCLRCWGWFVGPTTLHFYFGRPVK